jgi:hypothetical protein|tara:strand:- start:31 stop:876 length:846 start_codon:yes stop_codon:yes gene_type:complete
MSLKSRAIIATIRAVGKKKLPKTQIIINRIKAKKQLYESLKKKGPRIQTSSELRYKSKQKPKTGGGKEPQTQTGTHYGLRGKELKVGTKMARAGMWHDTRAGGSESWRDEMIRYFGGIHMSQTREGIKKSINLLAKDYKKRFKKKKLLAGGLLSKGIRLIYRDPKSREAIKKLTTYVKDIYKKKKLGPTGTLELKGRKIEGLKKYIDLIKSKSTVKHFKTKTRADKALKVMDVAKHRLINYEKKHKSIVKAYMHKKANPQIKTHSEGGEVVIHNNVDRSLL